MATIHESALQDLHPTQLTVGMIEVHDKKKHLASLKSGAQRDFLAAHPIPAVKGPGGRLFITDHHHLGRAALDAGLSTAFFEVEADLSASAGDAFWAEMNRNQWVHPLDANGVRHYYQSIPGHLSHLVDDVYRSLAGYVRNAGGYQKTPTAFAEFVWADFFRRNVPIEDVTKDFAASVKVATTLAQSPIAKALPGFIGK